MLELLKKVLKPVAPSGLEEPVAAVIREEVAPCVDSIETDALGNLICVKNGTEATPEKIMLSAHMDHIAVRMRHRLRIMRASLCASSSS